MNNNNLGIKVDEIVEKITAISNKLNNERNNNKTLFVGLQNIDDIVTILKNKQTAIDQLIELICEMFADIFNKLRRELYNKYNLNYDTARNEIQNIINQIQNNMSYDKCIFAFILKIEPKLNGTKQHYVYKPYIINDFLFDNSYNIHLKIEEEIISYYEILNKFDQFANYLLNKINNYTYTS